MTLQDLPPPMSRSRQCPELEIIHRGYRSPNPPPNSQDVRIAMMPTGSSPPAELVGSFQLAILDGEELIFRFAKATGGFVGQVYGLDSCKFDKIDALFFQTTEVDCPPNGLWRSVGV
jgi:hypothetical protein